MTAILKRVVRPFQQFAATESSGGVVLLVCAAIALAWANSPWGTGYFELWEKTITIGLDEWTLTNTIHHWINDGLMVVFFFLVGLEIKRELLIGELASRRQAMLPLVAAAGGMALPAVIYVAINAGHAGAPGWAIPVATDIAFALGVLALLGARVPTSLKIFLTALAIVDDLGAVLIIAVFYSTKVSWLGLGVAVAIVGVLVALNRFGVRRIAPYLALGIVLWLAVLASGVHATIAGVLLAMTIPARTQIPEDGFISRAADALLEFEEAATPLQTVAANPEQQEALHLMDRAIDEVQSPLMKLEHQLHAPVAFGIMPLFALANAGVALRGGVWDVINWRIVIGVVLGLVVGKGLGIAGATLVAVKFRIAAPMRGVGLRAIYGVSWLGGIGFTMSLFVAGLAFRNGPLLDSAKVGVLAGSLLAGVFGWLLLRTLPLKPRDDAPAIVIPFPKGHPARRTGLVS